VGMTRSNRATRVLAAAVAAGALSVAALAAPASAASSGWESILGGHIRSGAEAKRIAAAAAKDGFKVHVQEISRTNWETEIFNGGRSRSQAQAVCAKARKFSNLPHCSVEQEFHGNGWG